MTSTTSLIIVEISSSKMLDEVKCVDAIYCDMVSNFDIKALLLLYGLHVTAIFDKIKLNFEIFHYLFGRGSLVSRLTI